MIAGDRHLVSNIASSTEPSTVEVVYLKENLVSVVDVGGGSSESSQARENFENLHVANGWVVGCS